MTKLSHPILFAGFVFSFFIFPYSVPAQKKFTLKVSGVDRDSAFLVNHAGIQTQFDSKEVFTEYINKLPNSLQTKGYVTASIDTIEYDSASARIVLFLGEQFRWLELSTLPADELLLEEMGWREKNFSNKPLDFTQVRVWQEKILDHLENNGYPFGKVYLDSITIKDDKVSAILKIDRGPLYKIDSIRIYGNARISNDFVQHYLDIKNGSFYSKQKLQMVGKKIRDLSYVEEEKSSDLSMLPTGSVLNLYLRSKKSSQFNFLFSFLPNSDQLSNKKLLITGEGNLDLKNALGSGEAIGLSFQKLQVRSSRLNAWYQHPYLFKSPVGLDFSFDMYRRDSVYLNINLQLGASYILSSTQSGKLYIQHFQTIANGINTAFVLQTHRLPDHADVNSFNVGLDYSLNTTDYIRNPRKGNEFTISTTVGTKKIRKNNQVASLKDPNDPSFDFATLYDTVKLSTYQFRIRAIVSKYFPLGKLTTIKTSINSGIFQSGSIYQNELFQIGGFRLLRGFDEESQYLSQYIIGTTEFHYLIGLNSYFYTLLDGGWGKNNSQNNHYSHTYLSTGLGLAFETKVGIFNLAWAVGRRDDIPFNLQRSKIHFGFVNYF